MTAYMLDTNICSFILRERPPRVRKRFEEAAANRDEISVSVVTVYEMLRGGSGTRHEPLIRAFVARLGVCPWDVDAAEQAARVWRGLKGLGTPIGGADTLIAGHALALGCVIVTNNMREFSRVPGLQIEDWAA